jgi:hypothetical protein
VDAAQRLAAPAHRSEQRFADSGMFRGLAATVMSGAGAGSWLHAAVIVF